MSRPTFYELPLTETVDGDLFTLEDELEVRGRLACAGSVVLVDDTYLSQLRRRVAAEGLVLNMSFEDGRLFMWSEAS